MIQNDFEETCEQKYGDHLVKHATVDGKDVIMSRCCVRCGALYTPNNPRRVEHFS